MIALFRLLVLALFFLVVFIMVILTCLFSPRNPKHVHRFGRIFGIYGSKILGVKLTLRFPEHAKEQGSCVYIANHQSSYDLFTISAAVMPNTVTVGKKSLVWIPFFGAVYWLTGNILIDRNNRSRAIGTISQVADAIRQRGISAWLFPEGTRSRGRGLLPFKTGAFHSALQAEVPIIPIVCSDNSNIRLNRWNNGEVIVEMLDPIDPMTYGKANVRQLAKDAHETVAKKLTELNVEAAGKLATQASKAA